MGSVTHLYTTGDNDPEITPVQYDRHYLYCDECGAFELTPWLEPEGAAGASESGRERLLRAAFYAAPLVLVPILTMLGLGPVVGLAAAILFGALVYGTLVGLGTTLSFRSAPAREALARNWGVLVGFLPWLATCGVAFLLLAVLAPWQVLVGGMVLTVGLLVAGVLVGEHIESRGLRCQQCGATYENGSPLLNDLDANPRGLTIEDVPRPLGSSYFVRGAERLSVTPS